MQLVERKDIDIEKWTHLLEKENASIFSSVSYLDATAEHWAIWVDENYTKGLAIPYTIRMGLKQVYTPLFCRSLSVIGDLTVLDLNELKKIFKIGILTIDSEQFGGESKVFQVLNELRLNDQAKRKIKRFERLNYHFEFSTNYHELIELIHYELSSKLVVFQQDNALGNLANKLNEENRLGALLCFDLNGKLVGGLLYILATDRIIYLKGAFQLEAKQAGGMYKAMSLLIEFALQQHKTMDFGGSSVEGVRQFNLCFGGKDQNYYLYKWDQAPLWWKLSRKIYHLWKK